MKSMTGFGNGSRAFSGGRATVDIRAVNHRFLEVKLHLPRGFLAVEDELRAMVATQVKRGRLEVFLALSGQTARSYAVVPNIAFAQAYTQAAKHLKSALDIKGELGLQFFMSRPEVFQVAEAHQPSSTEINASKNALQSALTALERQRRREGKFLQRDLRQRIGTLAKIRRSVGQRSKHTQQATRQKLADKVSDLLPQLDSDRRRVLQDVASLVQKSDITEEFVRLQSHLAAFSDLLRLEEPVGKRMDFLLQEMQREVNTIGAKADDASIRHLVVQAKEEVEKIREQVQNIE